MPFRDLPILRLHLPASLSASALSFFTVKTLRELWLSAAQMSELGGSFVHFSSLRNTTAFVFQDPWEKSFQKMFIPIRFKDLTSPMGSSWKASGEKEVKSLWLFALNSRWGDDWEIGDSQPPLHKLFQKPPFLYSILFITLLSFC